jgi:hypothetical protein
MEIMNPVINERLHQWRIIFSVRVNRISSLPAIVSCTSLFFFGWLFLTWLACFPTHSWKDFYVCISLSALLRFLEVGLHFLRSGDIFFRTLAVSWPLPIDRTWLSFSSSSAALTPAGWGMSRHFRRQLLPFYCELCVSQAQLWMPARKLVIILLSSIFVFIIKCLRSMHVFGRVIC